MSSHILPPNPCLLAILLVVKSESEPKIAFHYPPRPGQDNSHFRRYLAEQQKAADASSSSDDDSTSSFDEPPITVIKSKESKTGENTPELDVDETGSASPEKSILLNHYLGPRWNDLFGLPNYGLARLLCPSPTHHKKKFELSVDDKVFVGRPIFAQDGEDWQNKKKIKKSKWFLKERRKSVTDRLSQTEDQGLKDESRSCQTTRDTGDVSRLDTETQDEAESGEQTSSKHQSPEAAIAQVNEDSEDEQGALIKKKILKMFHVVFVLNPPPLEHHHRVNEIYDNIIKKFTKALKWEQARSNYVGRELSAISRNTPQIKKPQDDSSLATLYHQKLSQSSLAKAISVLYNSISSCRIAHVFLTPSSSLSLQIPIPSSISILPGPLSPQMPGLWLTTATAFPDDDDVNMTNSQLASRFTLLPLADTSVILSDVADTDSPLNGPLSRYLQFSKPTKSFLQISQKSGIPLTDIQFMASHLIYWRRARAIPPLHQRDTYIVSPNADMSRLVSASAKFAKGFPALPPLPKLLSILSTPRPYSTLIPSKDHKEAFMGMLAWLLRDGWITQLRTFVWIRVPSQIKAAVESQGGGERSMDSSLELPEEQKGSGKDASQPLSVPLPPSPTSSTISTHTTIAFHYSEAVAPSSQLPSLLSRPRHATGVSSRHLSAISAYILKIHGIESRETWNRCVPYFDGRHAIETIAVQEGWKRKRVADMIAGWVKEGLLVQAKHW